MQSTGMVQFFKDQWKNTEDHHRYINDLFTKTTNGTQPLKELRDWVESNIWGFGERSFYAMWGELVAEMPNTFTFLEVGVFRGQILALIGLLSKLYNKDASIIGVTPLTNEGGYWESDYKEDIARIFKENNINVPYTIFPTASNDKGTLEKLQSVPLDLLYIDGGHEYETVKEDLKNYIPFLKVGGYLVVDDSANRFNLPSGFFRGHEQVSRAVDEVLPPYTKNESFEFQFNVVHNRIWKKIK